MKSKGERLKRYHAQYAKRRQSKNVAVTPEAVEIEQRAIALEEAKKYRLASSVWLRVFDAAADDTERARIAMRRLQCISRGNAMRPRAEYSGIMSCGRGVVYD